MKRIQCLEVDPAEVSFPVPRAHQHLGRGGFTQRAGVIAGYDLHYFVEGGARFTVDGEEYAVGAGEVMVRWPGQLSGAVFGRPVSIYHCHFSCGRAEGTTIDLRESLAGDRLQGLLHRPELLLLPDHLRLSDAGRATELLTALVRASESGRPGARVLTTGYLLEFLGMLTEETLLVLSESTVGRGPESAASSLVGKAIRLIDGRKYQRLSLRDVAAGLHVNPDYLSRVFRRSTGVSVGEYVAARRVECAKGMLLGASLNVKEVAGRLGFRDALYFSRFFKKSTGMSPMTYRKKAPG